MIKRVSIKISKSGECNEKDLSWEGIPFQYALVSFTHKSTKEVKNWKK